MSGFKKRSRRSHGTAKNSGPAAAGGPSRRGVLAFSLIAGGAVATAGYLLWPAIRQFGLTGDLEERVRDHGGLTLWLGTDDENGMTTLADVNLYPNVWEHIAKMRNLRGHPFEFYLKLGFAIVGVLPDANGPGKPDIFMAKSLVQG